MLTELEPLDHMTEETEPKVLTPEEQAQIEKDRIERERLGRLIPCPGCHNAMIDPQEPLPTKSKGWGNLLIKNGGTHALYCEWVAGRGKV
jgi:hypothetical protein